MRLPSFTRKRKLRVIFWSGFALEIKYKIKQIIVGASVNKNFKDNFKRSAQKKVMVIVIVIVVKIWHSDKFFVSLHCHEQLQGTRAHGVGTALLPPTRWDSRMEKITALDQCMPAAQRRTQTTGLHGQAAHVHAPSGKPHCALLG